MPGSSAKVRWAPRSRPRCGSSSWATTELRLATWTRPSRCLRAPQGRASFSDNRDMGTTDQYVATRPGALAAFIGDAPQTDRGANGWTVLVMDGVQDLDGFDDALRLIAEAED